MKNLLLIDRDPNLKEALRFVFPKDEWTIVQAMSSDEALKYASQKRPDMALVSSDLGDISGVELIKILNDLGYLRNVKVYILQEEGSVIDVSGLGITGVIKKPINYLSLYEVILEEKDEEEILRRKREEASSVLLSELSLKDREVEIKNVRDQVSEIIGDVLSLAKEELLSRIEPVLKKYLESYLEEHLPNILEKLLKEKIEELVTALKK